MVKITEIARQNNNSELSQVIIEQKLECSEIVSMIAKNPDTAIILYMNTDSIIETLIEDKDKIAVINSLLKDDVSQIPRTSLKLIGDIGKTLTEDANKIEVINDLLEKAEDNETEAEITNDFLDNIGEIGETLKNEEDKMKVINKLLEKLQNRINNNSWKFYNLYYPNNIRKIGETLTEDKNKIDLIKKLCENLESLYEKTTCKQYVEISTWSEYPMAIKSIGQTLTEDANKMQVIDMSIKMVKDISVRILNEQDKNIKKSLSECLTYHLLGKNPLFFYYVFIIFIRCFKIK